MIWSTLWSIVLAHVGVLSMLVFWWRGLLCWVTFRPAPLNMNFWEIGGGFLGSGFGINVSHLPWVPLCCSEIQLCWCWGRKWWSPLSHPRQRISHACCSGSPHIIVRTVSISGTTALLHFTFGVQLSFKTLNLKWPGTAWTFFYPWE